MNRKRRRRPLRGATLPDDLRGQTLVLIGVGAVGKTLAGYAKAFGLNVAWIERVTPEAMALACLESETLPPLTMFWALRTQMDELGVAPDHRIRGLTELPALVSAQRS